LSQSYQNIEITVIDDGSTDDTEAKTSVYRNRISYYYQNNSGVSAARNAGILKSRGEFVTCIDADDIMHPDKISTQVDFLKRNTDVPIVFTDYINFTGEEHSKVSHFQTCNKLMGFLNRDCNEILLKDKEALNILVEENFTIGGTPLFSRNALNKVGLYDSFLSQGEDFELHYRFAKHYAIGIVNKVMIYRRLHEDNATKKLNSLYQKAGKSRQKILTYEENKELRIKIKKWLNDLYLSLGNDIANQSKIDAIFIMLYSLKYGCNSRFLKNLCRAAIK